MEEEQELTKRERRALAKEQRLLERQKNENTKKLKNWVIGFLIIAGIFTLILKFWKWANTSPGDVSSEPIEITETDWVKGNKDAKVTLVEYGDFQCPACETYFPIVKKLLEDFPDVRVIYRHFPLVSIHPNALPSAKASEAAGLQGKFWEMHDKLYETQGEWEAEKNPFEKFVLYAKELGLDEEKFKSDFESDVVRDEIDKDVFTANRLKISSTPTFYVNGRKINNPLGYDGLKEAIEFAKNQQ